MEINLKEFFELYQDFLAPRLDTYEQAIYLYIFRHTLLLDKKEAVIPFKSARKRMCLGVGTKGNSMSEGTAYSKLSSLQKKGCIKILSSQYDGRLISIFLPQEIPGIVLNKSETPSIPIENMDFFEIPGNRLSIVARENKKCFYCMCELNIKNYVIEHLVSRPNGDNSYKNVVASCRSCNNIKSDKPPDDFFRYLYRKGLLSQTELEDGLQRLFNVQQGISIPDLTLKAFDNLIYD